MAADATETKPARVWTSWEMSESRFALIEVFFIFVVFFVYAGWPTPDDSEAHYLAIAKHAWNPNWIPDDLLLNSTNVHVVFTYTVGWLSVLFPLPVFAWVGRLINWWLLAWGWRRLSVAVTPQKLFSVLSASLFVTLSAYFHMSREWSVGGLEAKGYAYAFVLFALERLIKGRWNQGLALLGVATSFHVVVGGWSTLAAGVCWLLSAKVRPPFKSLLPGLVAAAALATPGMIPAIRLLLTADPQQAALANQVYVFFRLPHHLWPPSMGGWLIARHLLLFGFVIIAGRNARELVLAEPADLERGLSPQKAAERVLRMTLLLRMTYAAFAFSLVGLAIAFGCFWTGQILGPEHKAFDAISRFGAAVMKFYWFRLSDVLCPVAASVFSAQVIASSLMRRGNFGKLVLTTALVMVVAHLGYLTLYHQAVTIPRSDAPEMVANFQDWREISRLAARLPGAARGPRFLTPWNSQTFKWYSSRSEVASRKDIPQDAASIVEWWDRIKTVYLDASLTPRPSFTAYSRQELLDLAARYHADYVIMESTPVREDLPLLARNGTYAIYDLRPPQPADQEQTDENAAGR